MDHLFLESHPLHVSKAFSHPLFKYNYRAEQDLQTTDQVFKQDFLLVYLPFLNKALGLNSIIYN